MRLIQPLSRNLPPPYSSNFEILGLDYQLPISDAYSIFHLRYVKTRNILPRTLCTRCLEDFLFRFLEFGKETDMAWAYNTPDGTPNNGPTIAAVALAVTALALIALCMRIYVRTRITKAVGLGTLLLERAP